MDLDSSLLANHSVSIHVSDHTVVKKHISPNNRNNVRANISTILSYLINDHIVLFDGGLSALVEILCKCIHNAMQELNYKQWWYYREEQEDENTA